MMKSGGTAARVFVLSLLLGGCASSGSIDPAEVVLELPELTRTGVQPGDQVIIAFYTSAGVELLEISGERTVDPSGELYLPFLGEVRVVGMPTADIRRLLEDRYGVLYSEPVVEVIVNVHVNITGAVQLPGQFFVPPSATLVDALSRAGGVSPEVDVSIGGGASDPSQVRLVRDGVATVIDMRPLTIRPVVLELLVQSGDWLYVPRAQRSQTRETITFWGSLFSTLLTLATLIVLVTTN
jgi:protein involved in polysaccharide export with SLBB domain